MKSNSFLWILPFIAFISGYFICTKFLVKKNFAAPCVLGLKVYDAIKVLDSYKLNVKILKEAESLDLPDGCVINQNPIFESSVKSGQSVYLIINKHPEKPTMPKLIGLNLKEISIKARELDLSIKMHYIISSLPKDNCIAQFPEFGQKLKDNNVIIYLSSGLSNLRLVPNFVGLNINKTIDFLDENCIKLEIEHNFFVDALHQCEHCNIIYQEPLAGTIFDLQKSLKIKLIVE